MRDAMRPGDGVLFYHSSCAQPGIAGLAEVVGGLAPDPTQFDPASPYHDPKSSPAAPRWLKIDVRLVRKTRLLTLPEMRQSPGLASVTAAEWSAVVALVG